MNLILQLSQMSGEPRVLAEKSVAGVDGVDVGDFRRRDDAVHHADSSELLGPGPMQMASSARLDVHGLVVGLGIDGDRLDAEFLAGADDAQGDFAAVGDEDFVEHAGSAGLISKSGLSNCTGVASSTRTRVMTPCISALISFMTFIASMMQTVVSHRRNRRLWRRLFRRGRRHGRRCRPSATESGTARSGGLGAPVSGPRGGRSRFGRCGHGGRMRGGHHAAAEPPSCHHGVESRPPCGV